MTILKLLVSAAILATMTGGAWAADLPNTKGPPMYAPPPPQFTWTGLYVGAQAGYEWGTTSAYLETYPGDVFAGTATGVSPSGVVGGGHIGYNFQITQFVIGVEGDFEGTSASASALEGGGALFHENAEIQGSVRGRFGWAWDRVLIYGTGGVAFASIRDTSTLGALVDSQTIGRAGWTAGGGIEYALDPNWSVRAEYRYTDYGSYSLPLYNTDAGFAARLRNTDNRVEAGFSYKFDMFAPPMPVVAKY
ncbi:MAG: outer membrane protein [Methylovirgula sp.]